MIRTIIGIICIAIALFGMIDPPLSSLEIIIIGILLWAWDDIEMHYESLIAADIILEKKLNELLEKKSK